MAWVCRSVLTLLLTVTLFGAASFQPSVVLAAEIAAAAEPCCDHDCPDEPGCDIPCSMMARCGTSPALLGSGPEPAEFIMASLAHAVPPDGLLPSSLARDGPERPPRN
jgi:hypothetical protein